MSRSQAREIALQALFQLDLIPKGDDVPEGAHEAFAVDGAIDAYPEDANISKQDISYARELVHGTREFQQPIDEKIREVSRAWRLERMAAVDRNLMRMAVYEMAYAEQPIGEKIVINEAVELAKKYGTDDSSRYVNGILGEIARKK